MCLLAWVFCSHPFEILDERFLTVRNVRVVLDVLVACVQFDGFARFTLIAHQVVEDLRRAFVAIRSVTHVAVPVRKSEHREMLGSWAM
jgi:hypothetical protein